MNNRECISGLNPEKVWEEFAGFSSVPHCSFNEKPAADYIRFRAEALGMEFRIDEAGNAAILKNASPGREKDKTIVLQAHLDMVCEKDPEVCHDFSTEGIKLRRDGDWITAQGTTLGADNGLGVALALAVLQENRISHGPLAALFTVQEEVGLLGAQNIKQGFLSGDILINLDFEKLGMVCAGCAGMRIQEASVSVEWEPAEPGMVPYGLNLSHFAGGHSGMDIGKGRGNPILLSLRFLAEESLPLGVRIKTLLSEGKPNVIPSSFKAELLVPPKAEESFLKAFNLWRERIRLEFGQSSPDMEIGLKKDESPGKAEGPVFSRNFTDKILKTLNTLPDGALSRDAAIPALVETSANLGGLSLREGKTLWLTLSQRSSIDARLEEISGLIINSLKNTGFSVVIKAEAPAWQPDYDSELIKRCSRLYRETEGKEPKIIAIHAGLECGILKGVLGAKEAVSIGPDLENVHTPRERVSISSVEKFYAYLLKLVSA